MTNGSRIGCHLAVALTMLGALLATSVTAVGLNDVRRERAPSSARAASTALATYIDIHDHHGTTSNIAGALQSALKQMGKYGFKLLVLMPPPTISDQEIKQDIDQLLGAPAMYPNSFAVLAGGESLNVMIHDAVAAGTTSSETLTAFEQKAEELLAKGAHGFGEVAVLHLSLDYDHPYESAPADHPLFLLLADIAAEHGVPIDLHMDTVAQAMAIPKKLRKYPNNPSTLTENISGLQKLLQHNPNAKVIWEHLGRDVIGHRTLDLCDEMMEQYPNLYMSFAISPQYSSGRPTDKKNRIKADWLQFVIKYQDRLFVGSDQFFFPKGVSNKLSRSGDIGKAAGLLSQLPSQTAWKVGYENATRIFKLTN